MSVESGHRSPWRARLHEVIFEADRPAGKAFDVVLLLTIVVAVLAVVLESVQPIRARHGAALRVGEWILTILFTVEYGLRLVAVRRPLAYATSFYGVIDLLSILPTWLSLFFAGTHSLQVIRALRLLRVFRVFKVARYLSELDALVAAIRATRAKITVFLMTVLTLVLIMGALMYVIEGADSGFDSIPRGIYWAIVTVTTVGYGDLAPRTFLGQAVAAAAMVLGYCMIIIPTGIFSVELVEVTRKKITTQSCRNCAREGHDGDARFCKYCGHTLGIRWEDP